MSDQRAVQQVLANMFAESIPGMEQPSRHYSQRRAALRFRITTPANWSSWVNWWARRRSPPQYRR
jgi:hypothetical protein